ncbi:MAG: sensor histidine kinase [Candidatus Krumholzibacteria bacterium]|jgi:signal transduction histidine kinase|nr:sensor histidine kinase [Candidatus Krumholzibacteria bacterium]MDP6798156.1 sensor histidine kinase [Candidatus Krumholzibacteria bacterium]
MPSKPSPLGLQGPFGRRLFLTLSLLSLAIVSIVGWTSYSRARVALRDAAMTHVESLAAERAIRLDAWFEERLADIDQLVVLVEEVGGHGGADALQSLLHLHLGRQGAYRRALILDEQNRIIVHAGDREHVECHAGELPEVKHSLATGETVMGKVGGDHEDPMVHLAAPLNLGKGARGVLLTVMHPAETLWPILADTTGLGRTGETYLVGADTLMLSPSRNMNHPPALTHKMPTEGVKVCLSGKSGSLLYKGHIGGEVLGGFCWMPRQGWALMAEIQASEAFEPLKILARQTLVLAALALLVALFLSATLSSRLARPVERLSLASERVASGDLSPPDLPGGDDELGMLCTRFNEMVADLERHSRELLQAERLAAVGRLAAGVVHEMRNPLSALKMNLSALQRSEALSDMEREQLAIAIEQGGRLERMLEELLDYSRPVQLKLSEFPVGRLLERARELSLAEAESRGVKLELQLEEEYSLQADEEILLRALLNLVENALQFSREGQSVRLIAGRGNLEVVDEGSGMSDSVLERVFDPFFTTREGGTGLGMCNVKKFVEAHGGKIRIESREGRGTRVSLQFAQEKS